MHYQAATVLGSATCFGRSKHSDKKARNNNHPHGIYSVKTFNDYVAMVSRFGEWCKKNYGEKDLKNCLKYATPYLDGLKAEGKSVWTIHTYKFAIQKFFDTLYHGIKLEYETEKRTRTRITKNRSSTEDMKDFDETKHAFAVEFGKATGLRLSELLLLRYKDIIHNATDDSFSVLVFKGKGGKQRVSPVLPEYYPLFRKIYYCDHSDSKVFYTNKQITKQHIKGVDESRILPVRFPEHRYRRFYANTWYKKLARDIEAIANQKEKYRCRKDLKGTVYDRKAMLDVSRFLGHNRVSVIAEHYLGESGADDFQ